MFLYHNSFSWLFFMILLHVFFSWLFFMISLYNFLSNSLHSFLSWLFIITFYHSFLSKLFIKWSSCFSLCFSLCFSSCFSLWLSIKKIMQRRKIEKISIFNSFNVIFNFLMSQVENLNQVSTWNQYQTKSECCNWVFKLSQKIDIKTQFNDQFTNASKVNKIKDLILIII